MASDTHNLYGGHQYALKSANLELLGVKAYSKGSEALQQGRLSFPLFTLISYKGWRVAACSLLPISPDSLIYGSDGTKVYLFFSSFVS